MVSNSITDTTTFVSLKRKMLLTLVLWGSINGVEWFGIYQTCNQTTETSVHTWSRQLRTIILGRLSVGRQKRDHSWRMMEEAILQQNTTRGPCAKFDSRDFPPLAHALLFIQRDIRVRLHIRRARLWCALQCKNGTERGLTPESSKKLATSAK